VRCAPVVINGRAAVRREIGGVERFAREMALRLPALRPDRYQVVSPPPSLAHRAGHAWEQAALPLIGARARLIYSPANLAPAVSRRSALVIHDAAALRHPEAYSRSYVAYQRRLLPLIARRARLLFTVSEFARSELAELLDLDPRRIIVTVEGVDSRFDPGADPGPARARHKLHRPYVLTLGTMSHRKNAEALGEAARVLAARGIDLVLAGSDRGYLRGPAIRIRRIGYVPDAELPGLYAGALAFVLPSRHEGFGLPCLEAMACGIPVVAAAAGALPETVGDAGLLVDPDDHGGFASALLRALDDDQLRATLVAAGYARARGHDWDATAQQTDDAITVVLGRD
jgi:glycosyltransferase involved in cell wall biosynthesis